MKKLGLLAALCLSINAYAEEITGAFGLILGETIQTATLKKYGDEPTNYRYWIKPPKPSEMFQNYSVTVSPTTTAITKIEAWDSPSNCANQLEGLKSALERKYEIKAEPLNLLIGSAYEIKKNGAKIRIDCNLADQLQISYTSEILQEQQKQEEVKKSSEVDTSNL